MICVYVHLVEHVDSLLEHIAVQITAGTVNGNQLACAVDDAAIELSMLEDERPEEIDRDLTKGLVARKEVGAVEVAEDPIEVFLQ